MSQSSRVDPHASGSSVTPVERSLLFSASERYFSVLLSILSTGVLARLLAPWEFGVYAVVSGLTSVATASFQEFGGANYIIQKKVLSERDIRTAFTVTFGMSLAFAAVLFGSRHAVATFFGQPGLDNGLGVLCSTFLLTPFSVTTAALLRRDMQFGPIAFSTLGANIANAATAVVLAWFGFSFMAPVWGAVAGAGVLAVLLVASRGSPSHFRPSLVGAGSVFHFGLYSSAVVIVNVFAQSFPQFILGRLANFSAVGLYGRGASITQLFDRLILQVLNPVIMPAIFAETRAGGDLQRIYLGAITLISVVQWPFLIFLAIFCEPIIAIWLGQAWLPVAPIVRLLCFASLALFAACLTYPTLVAIGRLRDTLAATLITLPPSLAVIWVAAPHGAEAVAAAALLAFPLQAIVSIGLVAYRLQISLTSMLRAVEKSLVVVGFAMTAPVVVLVFTHVAAPGRPLGLAGLCGAGLLAIGGWFLGLQATGHPLLDHIRGTFARALASARRFLPAREGVAGQKAESL